MPKYAKVENNIVVQVQPYKGDGFEDVDGNVICGMIKNEDGSFAIIPPTPEQEQDKRVREATAIVNDMIQSVIDEYNEEHSLAFDNVNSLDKYTRSPNYTHWQFCMDVLDWVTGSNGIWETARSIQLQVLAGEIEAPADVDAFIAMLPQYTGVR